MLEDQYEVAIKRNTYGDTSIISHSRVLLSDRARLAGHILERWAMVAAQPDGEDAAGRQKIIPLEPTEMARRACDIADAAYKEFEDRKWFTPVPPAKSIFPEVSDEEQ